MDFPLKFRVGTKGRSLYFMGVAKGGSTLLNNMVIRMCKRLNVPILDAPGVFFRKGLSLADIIEDQDGLFAQGGMVYTGFRWLPDFLMRSPKFVGSKKLLLVRDPRDMIVSLYFSLKHSHPLPDEGQMRERIETTRNTLAETSIEDFVLNNKTTRGILTNYYRTLQLMADPNCLVIRYEDIIHDKTVLFEEILSLLDIEAPSDVRGDILEEFNTLPSSEDVNQHVRKALPGDHKEKLSTAAIKQINEDFGPLLRALNYV